LSGTEAKAALGGERSGVRIPNGYLAAAIVACLFLAVFLLSATRTTLWDRDEPRFCTAGWEMLQSGNYLYPTFNGELRPDKPVLVYWLMTLPMRVLGPTELACRFWSAVGIVATGLIVYATGRRAFGRTAGMAAMAVWLTSPLAMFMAKFATADAVTIPMIWGAIGCFVAALVGQPRPIHWVGMAVFTALAMLGKGPLGLIPIAVAGATLLLLWRRTEHRWRFVAMLAAATVVGLAIFFAWALAVNARTDGAYLREGIGKHVIGRMSEPMESHGGNRLLYLPYYIPVVLAGFFPWVALLGGVISAAGGLRLGGRVGRALLIGTTLPVFIAFSLLATKLPHYVLPMFPGLALAVGATLQAALDGQLTERDRRWLRRGAWALCILGLPAAVAAAVAGLWGPNMLIRIGAVIFGAALAATTIVAARRLRAGDLKRTALSIIAGLLVMEILLYSILAPGLDKTKITPPLVRRIAPNAAAAEEVATYGFDEPTLYFYLHRPIRSLNDEQARPREIRAWMTEPGRKLLVLSAQRLALLEKVGGPLPGKLIAEVTGYNVSNGRRMTVSAWEFDDAKQ